MYKIINRKKEVLNYVHPIVETKSTIHIVKCWTYRYL